MAFLTAWTLDVATATNSTKQTTAPNIHGRNGRASALVAADCGEVYLISSALERVFWVVYILKDLTATKQTLGLVSLDIDRSLYPAAITIEQIHVTRLRVDPHLPMLRYREIRWRAGN